MSFPFVVVEELFCLLVIARTYSTAIVKALCETTVDYLFFLICVVEDLVLTI
jgi:hypothetical protein